MAHVLLGSTKSYGVILFSFIFGQTFLLISFGIGVLPVGVIWAGGGGGVMQWL